MKKLIFIALVLVSSIAVSKAQGFFQFHAGPAFPNGDFLDDDYEDAIYSGSGYASTGLNLGIKYYSPLQSNGLSLILSMNFFYNPLSKDYRDEKEDALDREDITFPKYINVPIMGGVNYKIPVSEKLAFFGEGSLGFNILKITNFKEKGSSFEYSRKFSPSLKLGYTVGGGVMIQDKYSIGLNYYGLGSHKCKYEIKVASSDDTDKYDDKFEKSLDIREVTLTFGIKL